MTEFENTDSPGVADVGTHDDKVLQELGKLRGSVDKLASRFVVARVYAVIIALLVGGIVFLVFDERNTQGCLKTWATATSNRSNLLAAPSAKRNQTLDTVILDITTNPMHKTSDAIKDDALAAAVAAQEYERDFDNTPVPPAPAINCGIF